jgi:hypothetical protein
MTQVGEAVEVAEFVSDAHSEDTCPWHQDGPKNHKAMDAMDADEDTAEMPPNHGGTLGINMRAAGNRPPDAASVTLTYVPGDDLEYEVGRKKKRQKTVRPYEEVPDTEEREYQLQYAPHHLVPGNESLKGSELIVYMGDDNAISVFAGKKKSRIKDGFSIGYDVNRAANGVWLPSPYALSMKNEWPAEPGIRVLKRQRGDDVAEQTEDFKTAYVAASISVSGGRQFHMRHKKYSDKVKEILKAMAQRLRLMAKGVCPIAKASAEKKFDPPVGLVGRLDVLSGNLDRLLTGNVWRAPIYTDAMTEDYAEQLARIEDKEPIVKVL